MKAVMSENLTLLKRLADINRTITTSLDFRQALSLIAESGLEVVGATACLVLLREEGEVLRIRESRGVDAAVAANFVGSMDESILEDLRRTFGLDASRNVNASPIMADRTVQGILVVVRDAPLDAEETWLLSALADQAAIVLGNARLHEQLRKQVRRSEDLTKELEALIHTVAHDLRAPLRAMTGCGELLIDEYGEQFQAGKGREYLARIFSGARKMDALIHDLLTYSHLARAELRLDSVDLQGAISELLSEFDSDIEVRGAHVRVDCPAVQVVAHRKTLVRILGNLLSNALKFVEPGVKPVVEIRGELRGEVVLISVADQGIGIAAAYVERIFGVFERLNRAEDYPGTGIGLPMVRRAVERMGGRCGLESTLGKGSRFWIELRRG